MERTGCDPQNQIIILGAPVYPNKYYYFDPFAPMDHVGRSILRVTSYDL